MYNILNRVGIISDRRVTEATLSALCGTEGEQKVALR